MSQVNHTAFIKILTNAHPDRVRLLFKKYGINAPVSEQNLLDAIVAKGQPFIRDMATVMSYEVAGNYDTSDSNMIGEVTVTANSGTTAKTNSFSFDKILDWGNSLLTLVTGASGAYTEVKGNLDGTTVNQANQNAQMQYNVEMAKVQAEADSRKSQNTMIFAGVGIVVVLIVLIVIFKK